MHFRTILEKFHQREIEKHWSHKTSKTKRNPRRWVTYECNYFRPPTFVHRLVSYIFLFFVSYLFSFLAATCRQEGVVHCARDKECGEGSRCYKSVTHSCHATWYWTCKEPNKTHFASQVWLDLLCWFSFLFSFWCTVEVLTSYGCLEIPFEDNLKKKN